MAQRSVTVCPGCNHTYDRPRLLPCSHTLCSKCIEGSINEVKVDAGDFECPVCLERIRLSPRGVDSYMTNQFCSTLTSIGRHGDIHSNSLRKEPAICDKHNQVQRSLCMQCHHNKCEQCERSCQHQNHDLRPIDELADKGRADLDHYLQTSTKNIRHGSAAILASQKNYEQSLPLYSKAMKSLEERRDYFIDLIMEMCDDLVRDLKDTSAKRAKAIEKMQVRLDGMRDAADYAANLLDMGRPADIAQQHRVIAHKLKSIARADFYPLECEAVQIVYDEDVDIAEEMRSMFGGVYVQSSSSAPIPAEPSTYSVVQMDSPPELVGAISVPLHVNGIGGAPLHSDSSGGDVYIATKGIRLNALASLFIQLPSQMNVGIPMPPSTPEFHVLDYDTGQEVRSLTVRKGSAGKVKEVIDTGGDELRSFATKQRFLDLTMMSNGFIAATNDNKKKLCIFTPNGIVAREAHISKCKGPWGIACAADDILVVADCDARRVTIHDSNGKLIRAIEKNRDGQGFFSFPCFVAARGQVIVVSDVAKHRILAFTLEGEFLWQYGKKGGDRNELYRPEGVCIDPEGNVYVAENGNNRVSVISSEGSFIKYLLTEKDGLQNPFSMSLTEDNRLFILERLITKPAKPMKIKQYSLGT